MLIGNHIKNAKAMCRQVKLDSNMDELEQIIKLAGVNEFKGYTAYTLENISDAANTNRKKEREQNIKPGDAEWFKLWFSLPKMMGQNMPQGFRGRKK
jgi:hypothetical protein